MANQTYNEVKVLGRIGNDFELRFMPDQTPVVNLSIATNEEWKDSNGQKQKSTDWHSVVVTGNSAEYINNFHQKGDLIFITSGKLKNRKWTDKNTGQERFVTEIKAREVVGITYGKNEQNNQEGGYQQNQYGNQPAQQANMQQASAQQSVAQQAMQRMNQNNPNMATNTAQGQGVNQVANGGFTADPLDIDAPF